MGLRDSGKRVLNRKKDFFFDSWNGLGKRSINLNGEDIIDIIDKKNFD